MARSKNIRFGHYGDQKAIQGPKAKNNIFVETKKICKPNFVFVKINSLSSFLEVEFFYKLD